MLCNVNVVVFCDATAALMRVRLPQNVYASCKLTVERPFDVSMCECRVSCVCVCVCFTFMSQTILQSQ